MLLQQFPEGGRMTNVVVLRMPSLHSTSLYSPAALTLKAEAISQVEVCISIMLPDNVTLCGTTSELTRLIRALLLQTVLSTNWVFVKVRTAKKTVNKAELPLGKGSPMLETLVMILFLTTQSSREIWSNALPTGNDSDTEVRETTAYCTMLFSNTLFLKDQDLVVPCSSIIIPMTEYLDASLKVQSTNCALVP